MHRRSLRDLELPHSRRRLGAEQHTEQHFAEQQLRKNWQAPAKCELASHARTNQLVMVTALNVGHSDANMIRYHEPPLDAMTAKIKDKVVFRWEEAICSEILTPWRTSQLAT